MNQLELFRCTVRHEPHERFLWRADFTPDLNRRFREKHGLSEKDDLAARYGMFTTARLQFNPVREVAAPDFDIYYEGVERPAGSYIDSIGVLHTPTDFHHFTHYVSPLREVDSIEKIERFPYPYSGPWDESGFKSFVEEAHRQGRVASAAIGHMYEHAWQVRGYEPFLVDMMEQPEWCEVILDRFAERNLNVAVAAAKAGADLLLTADDVANQNALMFSRDTWRRFIKSRWAKVYAAARAIKPDIQIFYHSDGNIESIIPELIEIGVTILNPIQPECLDAVRLKKMYGDRIIFHGTIGTQTTLPFGTPDDVRRAVRENRKTLGADGALILAPTHVLEPDVPLENVEAFFEACSA